MSRATWYLKMGVPKFSSQFVNICLCRETCWRPLAEHPEEKLMMIAVVVYKVHTKNAKVFFVPVSIVN